MGLRREVQVMKIKGLLTDRQPLIAAIQEKTGFTAVYAGAPSFRYAIGVYTVLRDGSLLVDDDKADTDVLEYLAGLGLIESVMKSECWVAFSTDGFTGRTMVNLVNTLAARGPMINKALGIPNAVHMSAELVRKLKVENPASLQDFMSVLHQCGGEKSMKGIRLSGNQILFTSFPENKAGKMLAERIVNAAITQRWSKAKAVATENEKYSFRVWLNALGMIGPEYAEARSELLRNFTGDAAFRTEEQRRAFYETRRRNPSIQEPEFILL